MKDFIEKTLHQKIELTGYDKKARLPLIIQANYDLYDMEISGKHCLLARPKEDTGLTVLRKQWQHLEQITGLYCVLYLTKMNYYSKDKMLDEGIPFVWEGHQVYMPFLGIMLDHTDVRPVTTCNRISFLTQKLLLTAFYNNWENVTITKAAESLNVSKMSMTRCFDEIESLQISLLEKKRRIRSITCKGNKKAIWKMVKPFMRNPIIAEFHLTEDISGKLPKSGISALTEFSMLGDNIYPTYAITKTQMKAYKIREIRQIPTGEVPGCVVQELGYLIPFKDGTVIDPLTILLITEELRDDPRVDKALDEMLEEYVW
jgi:hypothetical protein